MQKKVRDGRKCEGGGGGERPRLCFAWNAKKLNARVKGVSVAQ